MICFRNKEFKKCVTSHTCFLGKLLETISLNMDITQNNNVHSGHCAADEGNHKSSLDQKKKDNCEVLWGSHLGSLCDPMDCSPPGSSVHGILQARTLELVAIPFSRRPSRPREWTCVSQIAGRFFTVWATSKARKITKYIKITCIINKCKWLSSKERVKTLFHLWRRKWQPTPMFLPGESQGWRSLVGCHPWGRTESDTTEAT